MSVALPTACHADDILTCAFAGKQLPAPKENAFAEVLSRIPADAKKARLRLHAFMYGHMHSHKLFPCTWCWVRAPATGLV